MNRYIANPTAFRKVLVASLLALTGSLVTTFASAADAPANKVQSIDVQPMTGGKGAQLTITTSGPAPEPLAFTIDNPARISLDLPDTSLALAQRRIDVRQGGLDSVLAAEGNGRSRLVLNLDRMVPYTTRVDGNRIIVTLGEAARAAPAPAASRASSLRCRRPCRPQHFQHRFPSRQRRHRSRDREADRSAHPDQPAPAGQPGVRGFRRRHPAAAPAAPLRRHRFRHAGGQR